LLPLLALSLALPLGCRGAGTPPSGERAAPDGAHERRDRARPAEARRSHARHAEARHHHATSGERAARPAHRHHARPGHRHHARSGHARSGHARSGHRFRDAKRWARVFERSSRDKWQKPKAVLALLSLRPTDRVADIGAATGYFPVRFARAVPKGMVYGFDVEPGMVRYLAERARREKLTNLKALRARPDGIRPPEKLDVVFTCNTYHHLHHRVAYLKGLRAHLEPRGRVVVVDFKQGDLPVGPPESHRVKPQTVARELRAAGYQKVTHDVTTLPYQFVYIYRK
jgi:ubiquinone/menaquinone biosynthesis C-methylase UbiE